MITKADVKISTEQEIKLQSVPHTNFQYGFKSWNIMQVHFSLLQCFFLASWDFHSIEESSMFLKKLSLSDLQNKEYRSGMTWGRANVHRITFHGWTIPLRPMFGPKWAPIDIFSWANDHGPCNLLTDGLYMFTLIYTAHICQLKKLSSNQRGRKLAEMLSVKAETWWVLLCDI